MPWKKTEPMEERLKLIADRLAGYSVTELSDIYGVSRKTVYKWTERYDKLGPDGLKELCRAPASHPNQTDETVVRLLVEAKRSHMKWGPKKVLAFMQARNSQPDWPSVCTVEKWFKKHGLVKARRLHKRTPPYSEPFLNCDAPNKVWSADYKGQFQTGDGIWCYPLTITDNMSRFLIACKGLYSPCHADTRPWFEWAFREFGLPEAIRTDNGTPFAGRGVTALSRLSVWWIKLGIRPERIKPGKPQQNGRHERMHRTLKDETASPPMQDMLRQQVRFDAFQCEMNVDRPHEALDNKTPTSVYNASPKRFPEKLRGPEYDNGVEVRSVRHAGDLRFKGKYYYLSELLAGEKVGFTETGDGKYEIRFGFHPIAMLDSRTGKVEPKSTKV